MDILLDKTNVELEGMAEVLARSINQINERGVMTMGYDNCAIGSVHIAAGTFAEPFITSDLYGRGVGGDVLRVLDVVAEAAGAHPVCNSRHTGAYIEGYGESIAHWDHNQVLVMFNLGLDEIQRELHARSQESTAPEPTAVERELVLA